MKEDKTAIVKTILLVITSILIIIVLISKNLTSEFNIEKSSNNNKEFYFKYENRNVYLVGIDKIRIKIKGKNYQLKKAILDELISFDKLFSKAQKSKGLWDGGTYIYEYKDFAIISCNRIQESNKDKCSDIIITNIKNKNKTDFYCSN